MADEHTNLHPVDGQKQGDPHPENPYSEHKYPTLFRLFDRGDFMFGATDFPKDLDSDYYLAKNWEKFVDELAQKKKENAALYEKEPEGIVIPDYEQKQHNEHHDEHHEEHKSSYSFSENYDVSAAYSNKLLNFLLVKKYLASNISLPSWFNIEDWKTMVDKSLLFQYYENQLHTIGGSRFNDLKRIITKHYPLDRLVTAIPMDDGETTLSEDQMLEIINQTDAALLEPEDESNSDPVDSEAAKYDMTTSTPELYVPIENDDEARSLYQHLVTESQNRVGPIISLNVDRNVFELFAGGKFVEGGWFDGDLYPARLRNQWINHGLTVNIVGDTFEQRLQTLKNFRIHQVVGKELGNKLDEFALRNLALEVKWKRGKFGSIIAGTCYGGLALWALYYRWVHVNNREYRRQKLKFAYRAIDEDSPQSPIQQKLVQKHQAWAAKYYEEDDDEEAEEEEEETDE